MMPRAATKPKPDAAPSLLIHHNPPALFLRTCDADMSAYGGFVWPASGSVTAPDWRETASCGHGLHGLLWGEGDAGHLNWSSDAKWMVFAAGASIDLEGKHKVETAEVRIVGDRRTVTDYLVANGAKGRVHGATVTAGDSGTATAGDSGTATAGYRGTATAGDSGTATAGDSGTATAGDSGTATAGYRGTATAGDSGTATAGDSGTATAGDSGTATAGYRGTATAGDSGTATAGYGGTATAGDSGTATAGDSGTATAGDSGTATAGYRGTATAGDSGTATAGYRGTATAGDSGTVVVKYYDYAKSRYRMVVGYVGEDGIEAGVAYRVVDRKLVAVSK